MRKMGEMGEMGEILWMERRCLCKVPEFELQPWTLVPVSVESPCCAA